MKLQKRIPQLWLSQITEMLDIRKIINLTHVIAQHRHLKICTDNW